MKNSRDERMHQVLLRGHATVAEILRADFGEYPPKGVDLAIEPKQEVTFYSMWLHSRDSLPERIWDLWDTKATARVHNGKYEIYVKSTRKCAATMGHEATHILQYANRELNDEYDLERQSDKIMDDFRNAGKDIGVQKEPSYYEQGVEIQARMHACLAAGYPQWGRLPGNKKELWAALIACGVEAPDEIIRELQESKSGCASLNAFSPVRDVSFVSLMTRSYIFGATIGIMGDQILVHGLPITPVAFLVLAAIGIGIGGGGYAARAGLSLAFPRLRSVTPPDSADGINKAQKVLDSDEKKVLFWKDALPKLYGDLLEMYGDVQGRARLGLGENERPLGNWFYELRKGDYKRGDFRRWAKAIGPGNREEALSRLFISEKFGSKKRNDVLLTWALRRELGKKARPVPVSELKKCSVLNF
jgi:hypothetical protein